MIPDWVGKYVGVPYLKRGSTIDGADCWGLIRLAVKQETGRDFPLYDQDSWEKPSDIVSGVNIAKAAWVAVATPKEWDVALIRMEGHPLHLALAVSPTHMLHTLPEHNAVVERYDNVAWQNRILGWYRYGR